MLKELSKMKKLVIVFLFFGIGACSLKEVNVATPTLSNTFNSQSDVAAFVNGCYSQKIKIR